MPPVTCGAGHPGHLHLDRPGPYAATPKRAPWPWAAQWCPGQPRRTLWPPLTQEPAPLSPPGTCWPSTPTPGRTHSLDSYCTARCGACGPPGTPSKSPISTPRVSTLCCGTRTTPSSSTNPCRKTCDASRPGSSDPMPLCSSSPCGGGRSRPCSRAGSTASGRRPASRLRPRQDVPRHRTDLTAAGCAYFRVSRSSRQACSQRRQACSQTLQCACIRACRSHSSPQLLQMATQASSRGLVTSAS